MFGECLRVDMLPLGVYHDDMDKIQPSVAERTDPAGVDRINLKDFVPALVASGIGSCAMAAGDYMEKPELMGLGAGAFFTSSVLVVHSLWPVISDMKFRRPKRKPSTVKQT